MNSERNSDRWVGSAFEGSRLTAPAHGWPWAEVSTIQGDGPSGLSRPPGSVRGGTAGEKKAAETAEDEDNDDDGRQARLAGPKLVGGELG